MQKVASPQKGRFLPSIALARWRWIFLGCLVLGSLSILAFGAIIAYITPIQFESKALVELHPGNEPQGESREADIATQCGVMNSHENRLLVVEELDLATRWTMDVEDAARELGQCVEVRQIDATHLVEIRCTHPNGSDARSVVEATIKIYINRRRELDTQRIGHALESLESEAREQEDRLEETRKLLFVITEQLASQPEAATRREEIMTSRDLEDATQDYHFAQRTLEGMRVQSLEKRSLLKMPRSYLTVHEQPALPRKPVPKIDPEMGLPEAIRAITGVALASLAIVYLLEAAFPARLQMEA